MPAAQLDIAATIDGDLAGARLINLGDGTAATDAVNKGQLDATVATRLGVAEKGQANGVATLDAGGKVPTTQIPPLAYVPISQKGQGNGVATLDAGAKVPTAQIPSLAYVPSSREGSGERRPREAWRPWTPAPRCRPRRSRRSPTCRVPRRAGERRRDLG